MDKSQAQKRIAQLKRVINRHNYLYHVLDKPEISDAAFDSLKHELHKLEQQFPDLITADSPTQRVSGKALDKFKKVEHKTKMLSLEDAFSEEEIIDWQKRIQKLALNDKLEYFSELKIDGFAVSLVYKNGIFTEGSTRGDGVIGEDVTQNLKTVHSIPLRLEIHGQLPNSEIQKKVEEILKQGELEVRGEVYMTKKAFEEVNREQIKLGLPTYANPRNTAAGSIRQLDPKIALSRRLEFLAYDLVTDAGQETHEEEHLITRALGFKTDEGKFCQDLKEVFKFFKEIASKREKLVYLIDGVVIQINQNEIFKKLGVAGKAPRGAIAFKFPARQATTIVENIIVQVGRTGALTPVAELRPINLGGTTITRATLHNEDEIKRLDIRIGDTVIVERAGDVIPGVVKVLKEIRRGWEKIFHMPKKCPACDSMVIKKEGEAIHRCSNRLCGGQQKERIYHFVSKKGFDVAGLGPQIINQLMDEGLVSRPSDIFYLTKGDLLPLERFGEKSAANLIRAIQKSKKIVLAKFIFALGIRHAGEETAIDLANYFRNLEKLRKAKEEDLIRIKDIGPIASRSILEWFGDKSNQKLLDDLLTAPIEIISPKISRRQTLGNLTFVLTGELNSLTREAAQDKIREAGGEVAGSVSKDTDYLVVGREPGSKYDKAKKLGVKIINEARFLRMVE